MLDRSKIKEILNHSQKSENKGRLTAMTDLAVSELGVPISLEKLDKNQHLLNCTSGTINLKTEELQPHNRFDYSTHLVNIEYDPEAKCPTWDEFIDTITNGDDFLKSYLQKIAGYSLTGYATEQCIFILYGTGANGKSTYIETIKKLVGRYAATINIPSLGNKFNNDTKLIWAELYNKRLVSTSEPERDFQFSESIVKLLSGGDKVSGRFHYGNYFDYYPTFKVFISTNYKPQIKVNDYGIWRRIKLIPFDVRIPESKQDKDLMNKLEKELPGILNWAIKGCLEWQKSGLCTPQIVKDITAEYKDEMDDISDFLNDCCIVGNNLSIPIGSFYDNYTDYCANNKLKIESKKYISTYLKNMDINSDRRSGSRVYMGITLKNL
jgi:putative DNA primase/helicase